MYVYNTRRYEFQTYHSQYVTTLKVYDKYLSLTDLKERYYLRIVHRE